MALNTNALKDDIKSAYDKVNDTDLPELAEARDQLVSDLAEAIEKFVKSGTVSVSTFTATAGNLPVTGTATGTIT